MTESNTHQCFCLSLPKAPLCLLHSDWTLVKDSTPSFILSFTFYPSIPPVVQPSIIHPFILSSLLYTQYKQLCTRAYIHTYIQTCTHSCIQSYIHIHIHIQYIRTLHTCIHTDRHTHKCIHTYIHTEVYSICIHTCIQCTCIHTLHIHT